MRIGIIGSGSIGLLFAACLSKNHRIHLYCRRTEQLHQLQQGILLNGKPVAMDNIKTATTEDVPEKVDLWIVAVKQYHLLSLASFFGKIPADTPILFLQNGMGHLDYLGTLEHRNLFLGVVEHGALKKSDREVLHTGAGQTRIALFGGREETFVNIHRLIHTPDFPFILEKDYRGMLVGKLVANAIINPLTAIFQVKNGELLQNPYFFRLMKETFLEIQEVLQLDLPEQSFQNVIRICEKTKENESSMLRDLKRSKETEIEAIIGYLLKEAEKKGVETKLLRFLYIGIKGLENKR